MLTNDQGMPAATAVMTGNAEQSKSRDKFRWFQTLDAMRGAAALYVVMNHATTLLMLSYKQAPAHGYSHLTAMGLLALQVMFAFGHQAVVLFFVLSGFLIHLRQAQKLHAGGDAGLKFDIRSYLFRRMRRIVPPCYFALLLTAGLDAAVRAIDPALANPHSGNPLADNILVQHTQPAVLLQNLLFLQWLQAGVPAYGNNTPLWSLAYEFYLYLLYPLLVMLRTRLGIGGAGGVVIAVSALAIAAKAHSNAQFFLVPVLSYWLCWCIGAWMAEAFVRKMERVERLAHPVLIAALTVVWLATVRVAQIPPVVSDTFGALPCALFLLRAVLAAERAGDGRNQSPVAAGLARVGTFSYSLYLTHVPLLALIWALWTSRFGSLPAHPLLVLVGLAASVATGLAAYQLVERRFVSQS